MPRLVLCGLALLGGGCVERVLIVRTDPPAARVFVDGREMGPSPLVLPFTYYGTRQVEVREPGYRTRVELVELEAPWWQVPPLDFFSELIDPRNHRVEFNVFLRLDGLGDRSASPESVQRRANELDSLVKSSIR